MYIEKEKFLEIAILSKNVRNELFELINRSQSIGFKNKEINKLKRSIKYLDEFRSLAENKMFSHGYVDENIFYGSDSK